MRLSFIAWFSILGCTLSALPAVDAATALTLVRDYDAQPGNAVDVSATTDAGSQMSLAGFATRVASAHDVGNGGVLDFEGATFYREVEFTVGSAGGGEVVLHDQAGGNGWTASATTSERTPISGNTLVVTGGTNDFGVSFGGTRPVEAVGITVLSRSGNAADLLVTAHFSNGDQSSQTAAMVGGNGTADIFFGFQAPSGSRIVSLQVDISSDTEGAGLPYLALDDLGLVVGTQALKTAATFYSLGQVAPRNASEISGSRFGVGGETMGRDYTVFANWKDYLAPLGAKKIRLQSGWAKTEKVPGVYDWAWLDAIIPEVDSMGVEPWVTLCYGNPIYTSGGNEQSGSPLPSGTEALEAWDDFVRAFVQRYKEYVDEWEIWNEPQHKGISLSDYTNFYIRTAEVIRSEQPEAQLLALSTAGVQVSLTGSFLDNMASVGKLGLVNQITYHPYSYNPDWPYGSISSLRNRVNSYGAGIVIRQGENGAPSEAGTAGALSGYYWTELSQAKWALRRLLGDFTRGIETSYFGMIDMWYAAEGVNRKGMIYSPPDQSVGHLKESYHAVQNLFALIDSTVTPDAGMSISFNHFESVFAHGLDAGGWPMVVIWEDGNTPANTNLPNPIDLTVGAIFRSPVYVDLRTGAISAISNDDWRTANGSTQFDLIPIYDSPVLIAEADAIRSMDREARGRSWLWQQFGELDTQETDWSADDDGDGSVNLIEAETGGDPAKPDGTLPKVLVLNSLKNLDFVINDLRFSRIEVCRSLDLIRWNAIAVYEPDVDEWTGDATVIENRMAAQRHISVVDQAVPAETRVFYQLRFTPVPLP